MSSAIPQLVTFLTEESSGREEAVSTLAKLAERGMLKVHILATHLICIYS
jgi:hypothetical protein